MMLPAHIGPGQVVAEVPHPGHARPPWRWFELDLDRISPRDLATSLPEDLAAGHLHVSGRTRHHQPDLIRRRLAGSQALTHVQFEARQAATARRSAALIRDAGLAPLPAIHLPHPPASAGELHRAAGLLTGLNVPLVKLAYPAPDRARVHWGTRMLASWNHPGTALALIPMGTTAGRAAALAAGSALIWAPPLSDGERWSTGQLLPLLTGAAAPCPCQGAQR
jgi:hypothetical protein